MRMVPGAGDCDAPGPERRETLPAIVALEAQRAVPALDGEHRTGDAAPEGEGAGARERQGGGRLVERIELPLVAARDGSGAVLGHVQRHRRGEAREALAQACRRLVTRERWSLALRHALEVADPRLVSLERRLRVHVGRPEG